MAGFLLAVSHDIAVGENCRDFDRVLVDESAPINGTGPWLNARDCAR